MSSLQEWIDQLYQNLSLQFSDNDLNNLWNLIGSAEIPSKQDSINWSKPASSVTARAAAGVSLSFTLAQILGPKRLVRLLSGQIGIHQLTSAETERALDAVATFLSRLKGPLLKLGQTASYMQVGLPPEVSERFKGLQSEAEPLPPDEVLENWREWQGWLKEFDPSPLGVGSIGQVHRGRLINGEEVAIKIQFPKIREAIQSDFQILRSLLRLFSMRAPKRSLAIYLKELEQRISNECDFGLEAESMLRIGKRFASFERSQRQRNQNRSEQTDQYFD
jgi:predicted unusual protein kinase regulating ubiquinone biosynthesis (AarF/ABC1/UbiB family)